MSCFRTLAVILASDFLIIRQFDKFREIIVEWEGKNPNVMSAVCVVLYNYCKEVRNEPASQVHTNHISSVFKIQNKHCTRHSTSTTQKATHPKEHNVTYITSHCKTIYDFHSLIPVYNQTTGTLVQSLL